MVTMRRIENLYVSFSSMWQPVGRRVAFFEKIKII